jgi:hypothetical protein
MTTAASVFQELDAALDQGGVEAVLQRLAEHLRQQGKYPELFEARKMQIRQRLGLPVDYRDTGELDEETGRRLEDGLLDACREVGMALLAAGRVREGWLYMRPVGDRPAVARALADIEVDHDNVESVIEVAFHEGVDVELGYRLVLKHLGTCPAITALESSGQHLNRADQRRAAALLVAHLHAELSGNLRAEIARHEAARPPEATLAELVADRDWLFGEYSYHIDTTHLASTVRAARILRDETSLRGCEVPVPIFSQPLRLAADLTEYGRCLHESFQFAGEEPFVDFYPSHRLLYRASLGEQVDEALAYFRGKAETTDVQQHGTFAQEVYVELLARLGRYPEAIEAAIALQRTGVPWLGFAPTLLELSKQAGDYRPMQAYCQERDDLLGYATALVQP